MQMNIRFALELYKVRAFHFPVGHLLSDSCSERPCWGVWVTRLCSVGYLLGAAQIVVAAEVLEVSSSGVFSDPSQEKKICSNIGSLLFMLLSY